MKHHLLPRFVDLIDKGEITEANMPGYWKHVYCCSCNQLVDEVLDEFIAPQFYTIDLCDKCEKEKEKSDEAASQEESCL